MPRPDARRPSTIDEEEDLLNSRGRQYELLPVKFVASALVRKSPAEFDQLLETKSLMNDSHEQHHAGTRKPACRDVTSSPNRETSAASSSSQGKQDSK